ncbi:MAG: FAD binding domain-containing protein [Proteobacteria bacterium]|nr:FAD binding domain-containing protein [Pseudomonadota bacterium]
MSQVYSPSHLNEVFSIMGECPDARLMAGGTDLLVRLRHAGADTKPPLILLSKIPELADIIMANGDLCIGSGASFSAIMAHTLVQDHAPMLAKAVGTIGGPAIRNMGTLGGNIITASPAGDSLSPLYVADAQVVLVSPGGTRKIKISEFINGPGKSDIRKDEILTQIRIPLDDGFQSHCFEKVGLRRSLAIAVASFCGRLRFDEDGTVAEARFAWGSVAPTVARSINAENALTGNRLDTKSIKKSVAEATASLSPINDIRASAHYRRTVAGALLKRFLENPQREKKHV